MARYIDVDKAYEIARTEHKDFARGMADLTSLREVLEDTPTADVVEMRHGEWVSASPSGGYDFYCSCCKEFAITYEDGNYREQYYLTDYCPNCGAKMDGTPQKEG